MATNMNLVVAGGKKVQILCNLGWKQFPQAQLDLWRLQLLARASAPPGDGEDDKEGDPGEGPGQETSEAPPGEAGGHSRARVATRGRQ